MYLQLSTTGPRHTILKAAQILRLLNNTDIDVNGIPYNLPFLCTTSNKPFKLFIHSFIHLFCIL